MIHSESTSRNGMGRGHFHRYASAIGRALVLCLAGLWVFAAPVAAQPCNASHIVAFSATSMNAGNYTDTATTNHTVTVSVTTNRQCSLRASFIRASLPAVMTLSPNTLTYTVGAVGGGASYLSTVSPPNVANALDITVSGGGGGSLSLPVQMSIASGQTVPTGTYTDTGLTLRLYARTGAGVYFEVRSVTVTPQATVTGACTLAPPSPATISFPASDIPEGVPNAAIVRSATLAAACSLPTIVRLTGSALTQTPSPGAATGFDDILNYHAVATFGAAVSNLTTSGTTPVVADSPSKNVVSGGMTGNIAVDVNLIAGQPLQSGTYTGVLTVTIDPSL